MTIKQQWLNALHKQVKLYRKSKEKIAEVGCPFCELAKQTNQETSRRHCEVCIYYILYKVYCSNAKFPKIPRVWMDNDISNNRKIISNRVRFILKKVIPDTKAMDEKSFEIVQKR